MTPRTGPFIIALGVAPIVVALLTFWILRIPVVALVLGGPYYIAFGGPVLYWRLTRGPLAVFEAAFLALGVNLFLGGGTWAWGQIIEDSELITRGHVYLFFGSIFAPLWGGTFAALYVLFDTKFPAH
ncbi:MAG: hypothetical protein CSA70_00570 [Rhodobacterales bacterium]|nr:MAG: hypothetical protein CSA70_00570 [Rhodobacterales bacterium]